MLIAYIQSKMQHQLRLYCCTILGSPHYLVVHINIHRAIYILFRQEILSAQIGVCKLIKTYGSLIWAIYDQENSCEPQANFKCSMHLHKTFFAIPSAIEFPRLATKSQTGVKKNKQPRTYLQRADVDNSQERGENSP